MRKNIIISNWMHSILIQILAAQPANNLIPSILKLHVKVLHLKLYTMSILRTSLLKTYLKYHCITIALQNILHISCTGCSRKKITFLICQVTQVLCSYRGNFSSIYAPCFPALLSREIMRKNKLWFLFCYSFSFMKHFNVVVY